MIQLHPVSESELKMKETEQLEESIFFSFMLTFFMVKISLKLVGNICRSIIISRWRIPKDLLPEKIKTMSACKRGIKVWKIHK